jgi:hypothetical protein
MLMNAMQAQSEQRNISSPNKARRRHAATAVLFLESEIILKRGACHGRQ